MPQSMDMHRPVMSVLLLAGAAVMPACSPDLATWEMPDPNARMQKIFEAGREKDAAAAPRLLRALRSEDPLIRMSAGEALQRITGADAGYHYYDTQPEREAGAARWRRILTERRLLPPVTSTGDSADINPGAERDPLPASTPSAPREPAPTATTP
ncbi:hypothetical protein BH11PLA1_BH11PLA1_06840 [soil metagenome]